MSRNLYAEVSERILAELKTGAPPWVKPWRSTNSGLFRNYLTGRPYSGANVVLLWMTGYSDPRFLTFKQALEVKGCVRKGEKGTKVYFVSKFEKTNDKGEVERIPFLKEYTVFNVAQCDGLPDKPAPVQDPVSRDETADAFVKATLADIRHGHDQAAYSPIGDYITMPHADAFKGADVYYATLFHELGHWTGAERRLNRDLSTRFGTHQYAAEELVAELTSAFLCAEFSFDGDVRHAGYIDHWIRLLEDDDRAFFTAASAAQKAADHLRGLASHEEAIAA